MEGCKIAVRMVDAQPASGRMTVVISNEFGGVIFHEAVGHALEASSVARGCLCLQGNWDSKWVLNVSGSR